MWATFREEANGPTGQRSNTGGLSRLTHSVEKNRFVRKSDRTRQVLRIVRWRKRTGSRSLQRDESLIVGDSCVTNGGREREASVRSLAEQERVDSMPEEECPFSDPVHTETDESEVSDESVP